MKNKKRMKSGGRWQGAGSREQDDIKNSVELCETFVELRVTKGNSNQQPTISFDF